MADLCNELAAYKFDLIKLFITNKKMTLEETKAVKETIVKINTLMEELKQNKNISCKNEMDQINEFVSKVK